MTLVSTGSGAWKAVQIDGERATDKEFNFLTCFEEITAYDIGPGGKIKSPKTPKKKKELIKKGLITDQFSPSSEEGKKHKKKEAARKNDKKKTKPKKKMQKEAAVEKSTDQQPDHHDQSPTSSEEIPVESSQEMEAPDHDEAEDNADESATPLLPGWDNLFVPNEVLKALKDLGFTDPTPIQKLVLPSAIRDRLDILGAAETGSGKTLAFGIPIVRGLLDREWDGASGGEGQKGLKALILTPTRELAIQVKQHIAAILKYTTLRISCLVGGLSVEKQQRLLKKRPHILVATPGRLWALLQQAGEDDYLASGGGLRFLVIDETDRMVEKGHFEELTSILEYFKGNRDEESSSGRGRQTFVFSATLTYVHPPPRRLTSSQVQQMTPKEKIDAIVSLTGLRKQRKIIDITRSAGTAETLTETRINCANLEEKDAALYYFLKEYPGRTLVFTNSIDAARRLHGLLNKLDVSPFMLHAKMHQKQRLKNLEKFIAGGESVLLATDVAARGLDIQGIEHVVHYQVPKTAEVYVHRSGRTARGSSVGLSVIVVDPTDAPFYRRICRNLNREKDLAVFPMRNERRVGGVRERVRVATQLESLEHRIRRMNSRENWFHRNAREADMDLDEVELGRNVMHSEEELAGMKRQVKGLEKELKYLLSQPLHGDGGTRTRYITSDIVKAEEEAPKNAVGLAGKEIEESAGVKKKSLGGRLKLKEKKKKGKKVPGKKNKPKKVFKRKKGKK